MRKVYEYSHLGGSQILKVDYPAINLEIDQVIKEIKDVKKNKVSKEKTMKGEMLYSPKEINELFMEGFHQRGFRELKDIYTIKLPRYKYEIKYAFKQIDLKRSRSCGGSVWKVCIHVLRYGKISIFLQRKQGRCRHRDRTLSRHARANVNGRIIRRAAHL